METLKQMLKNNIRQFGMLIVLITITLLFQILSKGILLMPLNVTNLILQNSYILILAIGMLLVIVAFHIDLSVGSVAAFISAVSGILIVNMKMHYIPTIILSLLVGAIVGAWHGWWIAYAKIPAFIVTLGGMLIFRGATMGTLGGYSIGPYPVEFQSISTGFIPDFFNGKNLHITTIVVGVVFTAVYIIYEIIKRRGLRKYNFEVIPMGFLIAKIVLISAAINAFTYSLAAYKGIPNILVLLVILIAGYTFITNKTVVGRHIYALGGNEKAARLSGVKTQSIVFWVFVNMGVLSALSGLVYAARLNAAVPKAGVNFELDAIAACFIGGASTSGGIGAVIGAIIGGLVMGIMNNGMSMLGVGIDWQQAIKGLVLLLAVAFDTFTKSKS
ncbi:MAG: multiple monosaccharide ABC transporter permease [Bacillota bacterium]